MTSPKPLTAKRAGFLVLAIGIILIFSSCTEAPLKIQLKVNHAPEGKILKYILEIQRVGKSFKNGELYRDIDRKMETEVIYTTKKVYNDGSFDVREDNYWKWDEVVDSGKVKRETKEFSFRLRIAPNGHIMDFEMLGDASPSYKEYAASYYDQAVMVFPDSAVPVGYSWAQTSQVALSENDTTEVKTTFKIKGFSRKMGYDCAIIEYRGNMALPYHKDPNDTLGVWGVDRVENNGILYFAYEEGFPVSSEERSKINHVRYMVEKGKDITMTSEFEEAGSYKLTDVSAE